jgi:hypothetical protein
LIVASCGSASDPHTGSDGSQRLPDGEFRGRVAAAAGDGRTVTWTILCGTSDDHTAMPRGDFTLLTVASVIEIESNPADPGAGHVSAAPLASLNQQMSQEWTVSVRDELATRIVSSSAPNDHDVCSVS